MQMLMLTADNVPTDLIEAVRAYLLRAHSRAHVRTPEQKPKLEHRVNFSVLMDPTFKVNVRARLNYMSVDRVPSYFGNTDSYYFTEASAWLCPARA
jgi:hypothetical protein